MVAKNPKAKPVRQTNPAVSSAPNNVLKVYAKDGDNLPLATAAAILAPEFRHAVTASQIHKSQFGAMEGSPGFGDYADAIAKVGELATQGDLSFASELLAAQALTLDGIFTEMARRMALNMGEYLGATETYARIALRAQANSRATIEALAKLHQPREQTVRHVHVNQGAQAVIAEQFHQHQHAGQGGQENGTIDGQPHATGTGAAGPSPALPSPNPLGETMPLACGEGEPALQDARGQG